MNTGEEHEMKVKQQWQKTEMLMMVTACNRKKNLRYDKESEHMDNTWTGKPERVWAIWLVQTGFIGEHVC